MNENANNAQEITLLDILKVVKKRLKNILCIALAALLVGGLAGVGLAFLNNATYGAKAQFYITSPDSNAYILSLLRSDNFAESLLLDENGLPADKVGTDEYNALLAMKEEVEALELENEKREIEITKYANKISNAQRKYNTAQAEYEFLATLIVESNSTGREAELTEKKLERDNARNDYEKTLDESQQLTEAIDDTTRLIKEKKEEIKKATDIILVDFRQNEDNQAKVDKIKRSVNYQYAESETVSKQASLTVSVAVKFDRELAEEIVPKINEKLADFVEDSIVPEKATDKVECTVISLAGEVGSADYKNPITQAVKYGALLTVAGLVISAAVYVVVDLFIKPQPAKKDEAVEE